MNLSAKVFNGVRKISDDSRAKGIGNVYCDCTRPVKAISMTEANDDPSRYGSERMECFNLELF